MTKIDFKKEWKHLYNPSKKAPVIVDVPPMNFLMIDGQGSPGTQMFSDAVESLYPLTYPLKFTIKKRDGFDYVVMPLEGLWWAEDMSTFKTGDKSKWQWRLMMMQPEYVTADTVEEVRQQVQKKKNPPLLSQIRFESYHEGLCVQLMHLGPYSEEGPNIERMHRFAEEQGYELRGKHHEIYLSDARRTAPERLKTILRQPIKKSE